MADERRHRGAHPDDPRLFGPRKLGASRAAVADDSALGLVGNDIPDARVIDLRSDDV